MVEFKKSMIENIRELPGLSERRDPKDAKSPLIGYRNTRQVTAIKNVPIFVEDVAKAALISRSNVLFFGSPGCAKTQICVSIGEKFFNGEYLDFRGSNYNQDVVNRFTRLLLDKMKNGQVKKSDELVEVTEAATKMFMIIDEFNRCPPLVQNQFFQLADGKVVTNEGVEIPLGSDGYVLFAASANRDPKKQTGIFPVDTALLERCHFIVNLDDFPELPEDTAEIIMSGDLDPRVQRLRREDHRKDLLSIYTDMRELFKSTLSPELVVMAAYLRQGFDYCEKSPTKSKKTIAEAIPAVCTAGNGCHRKGDACSFVWPASMRTVQSTLRLTLALQAVAIAKEPKAEKTNTDVNDLLETFELAASHSGLLDPQWVTQKHNGNPYIAMNVVTDRLKKEVEDKKEDFIAAFAAYKKGELKPKHLAAFKDEWGFVERILK
jgi:MoxR-like ATPase